MVACIRTELRAAGLELYFRYVGVNVAAKFDYLSTAYKMDSNLGYKAIGCDSSSEIIMSNVRKIYINGMGDPKCFLYSFAASRMPEHNIASEDLELVSEEIVGLNLVNV